MIRASRAALPTSQVIVTTNDDDLWDDAMSWERRLLVEKDDPRGGSGISCERSVRAVRAAGGALRRY